MKHLLIPTLFLATVTANAQELQLPQPSPQGHVEQVVGLTTVRIDYSRPSVKGRKIFGDLLPFGQVWRTGANKCTTISMDGPVMVEGNELKAGTYSVFTIPSEDTWIIIFNSDTSLWGEEERKDSLDVLQVKGQSSKTVEPVETLTFNFEDVKDDKARIDLRWENTLVSINIHADATPKALENIKLVMNKGDADFRVYASSARFLVDRNMMPEQALEWAEKSVSMEQRFWNTYTLALAFAQNGKYTDAIAMSERSMKLAQEAKYDAYVKMNKERIEEWRMKQ
jgi:hypothetical protein